MIGVSLGNLGMDYHRLGDFHKAIEYHKMSLDIARKYFNETKRLVAHKIS
jgi:hypothetical protein